MADQESERPMAKGGRNQRVARAGEFFIVAELNKRGAHAVCFTGNMPKIDVIACHSDQSRTVYIQVKTKRSGRAWQTTIREGRPAVTPQHEDAFWVFVDLGAVGSAPRYWVVPDGWIRHNIYQEHQAYLARHGGVRAKNPNSLHHSIDERRLLDWQDRWDILGVCDPTD